MQLSHELGVLQHSYSILYSIRMNRGLPFIQPNVSAATIWICILTMAPHRSNMHSDSDHKNVYNRVDCLWSKVHIRYQLDTLVKEYTNIDIIQHFMDVYLTKVKEERPIGILSTFLSFFKLLTLLNGPRNLLYV